MFGVGFPGRTGLAASGSRLLYPAYVQDYLDRVTAADVAAGDTQGLERGVTDAFNVVLQGIVDDVCLGVSGNVISQAASKIKAMPFLCGARTLNGCLVPVVGTAPTNFNFVGADYNRKTGLIGNGATKWLDSNRNNTADPQDNKHVSVYVTAAASNAALTTDYLGTGGLAAGGTRIIASSTANTTTMRVNNISTDVDNIVTATSRPTGLYGASRSSGTSYTARAGQASFAVTRSSATPLSGNINLYRRSNDTSYTDARFASYSIGEAVDLAALEARIATLISTLAGLSI